NEHDEKISAIPFGDPQYNSYTDISQLPAHILDELKHFLSVYKQLENKKVDILSTGGAVQAKECIVKCMKDYKEKFEK
ncbi:MAG: inorganic diphosphatase, partial [Clostridia bacterium]|nr:inorganic diphosphatase [Clostridia bacterium]